MDAAQPSTPYLASDTGLLPTEVTGTGATLLATLSGQDRPGVTRALFERLAAYPLVVLDVEQVVIRGRLVLGVLVAEPAGAGGGLDEVAAGVREVAADLGMELSLSTGASDVAPSTRNRLHVTLIGAPLRPAALAAIASRIAEHGANIDRIERLAHYPVTAIELVVSGAEPAALRRELAVEASHQKVDVAVQRAGLQRRAKRLVVMDVDSTLVQGEVIEMLAARAGVSAPVAELTEAAMRGEVEFAESLRSRVSLLAGLGQDDLDAVRGQVRLSPGARTLVRTLKRLGFRIGIVSGGFSQVTDALATDLGLDYAAANTLEVVDGRLTGRLAGPLVDRAGKATALARFAREAGVPLAQTVAIGDGANDLDMLQAAGLGIAFNAKPVVREAADAAVNVPYLDAILYLLGVTREEVEEADRADAG